MRTSNNIIIAIRFCFLGSIIAAIIFSGPLASALGIKKEQSCISCHEEIYEKDANLFYLHPSFQNKKCEKCHIKTQGEQASGGSRWEILVRPELVSRPDYLPEHTLLLQELDSNAVYDINIISRDMAGDQVTTALRDIIPSKVSNVKTEDRVPPVLSGVKNGPAIKRIFLETTIFWDTDEPATGNVEYGLSPQYSSNIVADDTLKRHHEVTLSGLEQGKVYHYRVISQDIRGNQSVSKDFVFDTSKILSGFSADMRTTESESIAKLALKRSDLFVLDADLGLYIETTKPANVTVEYLKVKDSDLSGLSSDSNQDNGTSEGKPKSHKPGFRTGKELCIDLCYECHTPDVLGVSHPVGVSPKDGGARVPEDLPTLEGAIITCVTCHHGHGGELRYFARKRVSREICNSCHDSY